MRTPMWRMDCGTDADDGSIGTSKKRWGQVRRRPVEAWAVVLGAQLELINAQPLAAPLGIIAAAGRVDRMLQGSEHGCTVGWCRVIGVAPVATALQLKRKLAHSTDIKLGNLRGRSAAEIYSPEAQTALSGLVRRVYLSDFQYAVIHRHRLWARRRDPDAYGRSKHMTSWWVLALTRTSVLLSAYAAPAPRLGSGLRWLHPPLLGGAPDVRGVA